MWSLRKRKHAEIVEPPYSGPVLFSNQPSGEEADDLVGVQAQVSAVERAIGDGNRLIGLLSDFGAGKSTLIKHLHRRYAKRADYQLCTIHLWGELANQSAAETALHKSFLYQFAQQVSPSCGTYVNQRLNVGYKLVKLSLRDKASAVLLALAAVLAAWALLFHKKLLPFPQLLPPQLFSLMPLLLAGVAVCLLVVCFKRSELLFSSPKDQRKQELHAEDYSEIYQYILRACKKPKILLIFEDIDRTPDAAAVYRFLVELHRYYLSIRPENVTFFINMKPQAILERMPGGEDAGMDFVKLFDYTLTLTPLNTADLSALLLQYAQANAAFYRRYGALKEEPLTSLSQLPGFSRLAHGKTLDIRHLKHRVNFTNQLFYNLKERFADASEKIDIQLRRCVAVAYLEDEYPREFYRLDSDSIGKMITEYIQAGDASIGAWEGAVQSVMENVDPQFVQDMALFLSSGVIDSSYRVYFSNYPKLCRIRTFAEEQTYNALIYGQTLDDTTRQSIRDTCANGSDVIHEALDYLTDIQQPLHRNVFTDEVLYFAVLLSRPGMVEDYLLARVQVKQPQETISLLDDLTGFPIWETEVCTRQRQIIASRLGAQLRTLERGAALEFRTALAAALGARVTLFAPLYRRPHPPLTVDEMENIPAVRDLLRLTEAETVTPEVIQALSERFQNETPDYDANNRAGLEALYRATLHQANRQFTARFYAPILLRHLLYVREWDAEWEQQVFDAVQSRILTAADYAALPNRLPMEDAPPIIADHIAELGISQGLCEAACAHLLRHKKGLSYFLNARDRCASAEITWSPAEAGLLAQCAGALFEADAALFRALRLRLCQQFSREISQYRDAFAAPLPIVQQDELALLPPDAALELLSVNQLKAVNIAPLVRYFCEKPRGMAQTGRILDYATRLEDRELRAALFRGLDFQQLSFAGVGKVKKFSYRSAMKDDFKLHTAAGIVAYMEHTRFLDEELERSFLVRVSDGGRHEADFAAYAEFLMKPHTGSYSDTTLRIVDKDPYGRKRPAPVLQMLFDAGRYRNYVISKRLSEGFTWEADKLDALRDAYVQLYKECRDTHQAMLQNRDAMQALYAMDIFDQFNEEALLPFARFPQTVSLLNTVLARGDAFLTSYFAAAGRSLRFADEAGRQHLLTLLTNDAQPRLILNDALRKSVLRGISDKALKQQLENARRRAKTRLVSV